MTIKQYWNEHGTKIIGFASTAIGVLTLIDANTLQLIEAALGPKIGGHIGRVVLIVSGVMTAYRGFQNSRAKENVLPPPQPGTGS